MDENIWRGAYKIATKKFKRRTTDLKDERRHMIEFLFPECRKPMRDPIRNTTWKMFSVEEIIIDSSNNNVKLSKAAKVISIVFNVVLTQKHKNVKYPRAIGRFLPAKHFKCLIVRSLNLEMEKKYECPKYGLQNCQE